VCIAVSDVLCERKKKDILHRKNGKKLLKSFSQKIKRYLFKDINRLSQMH